MFIVGLFFIITNNAESALS